MKLWPIGPLAAVRIGQGALLALLAAGTALGVMSADDAARVCATVSKPFG